MLKEAYMSKYEMHKNTTPSERLEIIKNLIIDKDPEINIQNNTDNSIVLSNINIDTIDDAIQLAVSSLYQNVNVPILLLYNKFPINNKSCVLQI